MSDNITLSVGSGGETLATDDISSAHYQKVLLGYGADGTWTRVNAAAGLPVQLEVGSQALQLDDTDKLAVSIYGKASAAGDKEVLVDASGHLQIDVLSTASHAVTNIGTFAVQVNGAALTALQIIDDWDESDRAKVNPIAGQAGVAAGAGAVGVTVPRVTLASDDPGVALLGTIDADTGAIKTSVEILDNAISGNEMQVDVVAALPAGNNNIGDVDVASVPAPLNVVGGGAETTALRVTLANDSTGLLTVDTAGTSGLEVVQSVSADLKCTEASASAALTALQIMDDWDESNRAMVNPIVGQAGIAADAGAVGVTVPRVTLASDDPGVALLATIDADTGAIKTAVEIIDDWDDGSDHCEVVGAAAENAAVSGSPVLAAGRYDSSERTTGNGDATTLAASAQGWMMVGNQSSYLFDGVTRCEIKRATGVAANGTVVMIAAVGSMKIRCLALGLWATSATATNIYIANDNNDLLGEAANPIPLAVDADGDNTAGFIMPWNPGGWFQSDTVNEAINLILSAAQDVVYAITYIEVA